MKRKTDNFSKFYTKKNNAAIKESFRQEKKAAKKERKEAIERHFEEKRKYRAQQGQTKHQPQQPTRGTGPDKLTRSTGPDKTIRGTSPDKPTRGAGPGKPIPANAGKPANDAAANKPGTAHSGEQLPLNKYIAHSGICSRRDAAELIKHGKVTVNGKPITEPGTKVQPSDLVKVNGKTATISRNFVYILLNKPKDYITTTDDPQGRKTVLDLIRQATTERVFPVGRLDRNTSGVLLLTNDGDLAQKLAHPSHEIKKIYHVVLDKPLTKADFDKIINGVTLEDGPAQVDVLAYADPKDRTQIGIEIHSGRNRIVRRIFEHLGYDVRGLDRVTYAGLTKKNVQRGKWRLLNEKEIRILKYLNSSFKGSLARPAGAKANAAQRDGGNVPAQNDGGNVPTQRDGAKIPGQHDDAKVPGQRDGRKVPGQRDAAKVPGRYAATDAEVSPAAKAMGKAGAHSSAPAKAAASSRATASSKAAAHRKPKPALTISPKGEKKTKPVRARKPYNSKSPRPEKE
jgi:23S rRNA pseudouridine2605 synthase